MIVILLMKTPENGANFDPNGPAHAQDGIFGLPGSTEDAKLIYLPVPWEATVSYGGGTSQGPSAVLQASVQQDLYDAEVEDPYQPGLHMLASSSEIQGWNEEAMTLTNKEELPSSATVKKINTLSEKVNQWVFDQTLELLDQDKIVAVLGGDHSSPLGAIRAMAQRQPHFGILHIDAHMDLRQAYMGYQYSHASVMYNVLKEVSGVSKLVQIGLRDFCQEEVAYAQSQAHRIAQFSDAFIHREKFSDRSWKDLVDEMIDPLPEHVWISFDIDGLDPKLCPNTGTPVPGGLSFNEAVFIVSSMVRLGHKIIGFDLCEVSPGQGKNEWDANVGMRMLYKLSAWTLASQGYCQVRNL